MTTASIYARIAPAMLSLAVLAGSGCGPRVIIATGTTIGLKANPGDAQGGRSPQVTLGYKRAEAAIVATKGDGATTGGEDAYSTFASLGFQTRWFGDTELTSFIASGYAARGLVAPDADAPTAAAAPDVKAPPPPPPPPPPARSRGMVVPPQRATVSTGNSFLRVVEDAKTAQP